SRTLDPQLNRWHAGKRLIPPPRTTFVPRCAASYTAAVQVKLIHNFHVPRYCASSPPRPAPHENCELLVLEANNLTANDATVFQANRISENRHAHREHERERNNRMNQKLFHDDLQPEKHFVEFCEQRREVANRRGTSHALLSEGLVARPDGISKQRKTPISRLSRA